MHEDNTEDLEQNSPLNQKSDQSIPDQATSPYIIGPHPQSHKKRNFAAVLVILVLFLLAGIGFTQFKPQADHSVKNQIGAKSENNVTGDQRSVFAYIDGASEIQSADFEVNSESQADHPVLPFLKSSGKVFRDKDSGELHAQLSVDKKFVEGKIIELKEIIDYDELQHQTDLTVSESYEIDMAGLMSKLGILPTLDYAGLDLRESVPSEQTDTCKASIKTYEKYIKDELNKLQPNYEKMDSDQTVWTVELGGLAETTTKQLDLFSESCHNDTSEGDRDPDYFKYKDKLRFITKQDGLNIKFEVILDDSAYSGDEEYLILAAVISNIRKDSSQIVVEEAASVFSVSNTSAYILAINRCRNLPVIVGGGLFGNYGYDTPDNTLYAPSFFDTAYYCTAEEATSAGYKANDDPAD